MRIRFLSVLGLVICSHTVWASSSSFSPELSTVFQNLSTSASPQQYHQIVDAAKASTLLTNQLNQLATSGKLTAIKIVDAKDAISKKGMRFGGLVDGGVLVLTPDFLQAQLKNRLYDVVNSDDILPNNTVFVLGHLAYHLDKGADLDKEIKAGMDSFVAENTKTGAPLDATKIMLISMNKQLGDEASAFIQAWDDEIDAATQENKGVVLNLQQVGKLTLNSRYRYIFIKALREPDKSTPLAISTGGVIELNQKNIDAIVAVLRTAPIADVE